MDELRKQLSPEAEILLLIMAANGGELTQDDGRRELARVLAMTAEERAEWRRRIVPLAQMHARRHLRGEA